MSQEIDIKKKVFDGLTFLVFLLSTFVVFAMQGGGFWYFFLLVAISIAFDWTLRRNVEYGMALAYEYYATEEEK